MTRRTHVKGFADLLWRMYDGNEAVKHAITVLVLAAVVAAANWISGTARDRDYRNVAGVEQQISGRLDTIAAELKQEHHR